MSKTYTIDSVEYTRPILIYSTEDEAEAANDAISTAMGLDGKSTVTWDIPKAAGDTGKYYIIHPIVQRSDYETILDGVDVSGLMELDTSWISTDEE